MGRIGRLAVCGAGMLLILCISRRTDAATLAVRFCFPNLAASADWNVGKLPITSEMETTFVEAEPEKTIPVAEDEQTLREQLAEENQLSFETLLEEEETSQQSWLEEPFEAAYTEEQLKDFDFLLSRLYNVDASTKVTAQQLDAEKLLAYDFHVEKEQGEPQILIYHTHSQEAFADSIPGDARTTIVGMGDYLAELLEEKGFGVIHNTEVFDMENGQIDRNKAYTRAEPVIAQILAEHPEIRLVIDLHRDGVSDKIHLVREINGKPTAQVMFFNGLSYSAKNGAISYLPNPYIENNLALTMQMKLASDMMYPGFARKVYLKSLRFNLHLHPNAMLIEAGAQTNTVAEMRSAMEVLAQVLEGVLY